MTDSLGTLDVVAVGRVALEPLLAAESELSAALSELCGALGESTDPAALLAEWRAARLGEARLSADARADARGHVGVALDASGRVRGLVTFLLGPRGGPGRVVSLLVPAERERRLDLALLRYVENFLRVRGRGCADGWPLPADLDQRDSGAQLGWGIDHVSGDDAALEDIAQAGRVGRCVFGPRRPQPDLARFAALRSLLAGAVLSGLALIVKGLSLDALWVGAGGSVLALIPTALYLRAFLSARERPLLAVGLSALAVFALSAAGGLWLLLWDAGGPSLDWRDSLFDLWTYLAQGPRAGELAESLAVVAPLAGLFGLTASQSVLDRYEKWSWIAFVWVGLYCFLWVGLCGILSLNLALALDPSLLLFGIAPFPFALLGFTSGLYGQLYTHFSKWIRLRERGFPYAPEPEPGPE